VPCASGGTRRKAEPPLESALNLNRIRGITRGNCEELVEKDRENVFSNAIKIIDADWIVGGQPGVQEDVRHCRSRSTSILIPGEENHPERSSRLDAAGHQQEIEENCLSLDLITDTLVGRRTSAYGRELSQLTCARDDVHGGGVVKGFNFN